MTRNWIARTSQTLKLSQDDSRRTHRSRSCVSFERLEGRVALSAYTTSFVPAAVTAPPGVPGLAEKAYAQAVDPANSRQNTGFQPFDTAGSMTQEREPITPAYAERRYPGGAGSSAIVNPNDVGPSLPKKMIEVASPKSLCHTVAPALVAKWFYQ
jgi:hypothetical protein